MRISLTLLVLLSALKLSADAAEVIVLSPIEGTGSYNLVPNGDFDSGIGGWSRINTEPYGLMSWDGVNGFNGIGSITTDATIPRTGPGFAYQRQITGLNPAETYVLSAAFNVDSIDAGQLYVDMTDAIGGDTGYRPDVLGFKPDGWFFTYNTFTPNGTTAIVRVIRDRYGNDLDPGGFVDEIAVTPLAAFSAPVTAVPEPASVGGLALAAVVIATRRLRRRRLEQRS